MRDELRNKTLSSSLEIDLKGEQIEKKKKYLPKKIDRMTKIQFLRYFQCLTQQHRLIVLFLMLRMSFCTVGS